ncbi:hypothetical protein LR48_Vigan272s003200 [Vigna angularis]|uniref:AT-hook motif nuclear-localized protein n=2 Tax=Phaseolus angularis TaxID=3914 RepID=A0A0L9T8N5_PHAAN|nr:AT-hook motif nuclear-localized protein 17 [Vigna angularis]KAG2394372.1 AT-hook motif nuclear-localized protein [Vigna angularis]KOM26444.1 hypothetical protein LR48_Vigan272s003200 [Vigna angularis]BAT88990.1 hypothetical protein VIGAN_05265300 [Vigna angularis var. angularis]
MTNNPTPIATKDSVSEDHHIGSSSQRTPPPPLPPSPPPPTTSTNQHVTNPSSSKPRGRPLGSKNKSKPIPLPVPLPTEPSVAVLVVTVDPNRDIMECILDIAHQDHVSLSIVSAIGMINSVTLRNSTHGAPSLVLHGPFKLLSLTGSYLYRNEYTLHLGATPPRPLSFGINFSAANGEIFTGIIGGSVVAGEGVSLTVSTFKNPDILKYAAEREEGDDNNSDNDNTNPNDLTEGGDDLRSI